MEYDRGNKGPESLERFGDYNSGNKIQEISYNSHIFDKTLGRRCIKLVLSVPKR